jgi:hypothetical protein
MIRGVLSKNKQIEEIKSAVQDSKRNNIYMAL